MFNKFDIKRTKKVLQEETRFIEDIFCKMPLRTSEINTNVKTEDKKSATFPRIKPVFNAEGHMVFSKFDFSEIGTKQRPQKFNKKPSKILQQLKNKKRKLKDLEDSGEKKRVQSIKDKESWQNVIAKANGEKIKNDPELLKRTIRRSEQKKRKSSKKWQQRVAGVEKAQQERGNKRQENILKRKREKKVNKLKKASKKGRIIAGF